MFCGNCGSKVDDNLRFCPNCGFNFSKIAADDDNTEYFTESAGAHNKSVGNNHTKHTVKVAIIVCAILAGLVLVFVAFIGWQLAFNDGNILQDGYNALQEGLNEKWRDTIRDDAPIVHWGDGTGFDIDTK